MAEQKDVLLSLTVDIGDSANRIAGLTTIIEQLSKSEKELRKQMAETDTTTKEGKAAYAELAKELATVTESKKAYAGQLREESKVVQNTIKATGDYERSLQGMADKLAQAKKELRGLNMYMEDGKTIDPEWERKAKEVKALNDAVTDAEAAYGVYARNVGNYSNRVMGGIETMLKATGSSANGIINPLKNMKVGFDAISKTPVIAILGLLVTVITKVTDALEGSEENTNAMSAALAPFKAITDLVTVSLQKMGEWLGKATKAVTGFIAKHAEEYKILGKVNDRIRERQDIEAQQIELTMMSRENLVQNAKDEQRIAELRNKAADKVNYSAKERIAYLQEAADLQNAIADREVEAATKEYEVAALRAKQAGNSKEENDALAAAEAKMIQAQTARYNKQRELTAQISEARTQEIAQAKAAADERRRAEDEAAKAAAEAANAMQESFDRIREAALGDTIDYQLEQAGKKYEELYAEIAANDKFSADEAAYYSELLREKQAAEEAAIRQKPIDEQLKREKEAADEAVKEREKAYADELAAAWNNADEQYRIRKKYIEALLEDETVAADKKYQLEKELAELQSQHEQQRIAALTEYGDQIATLLSNVSSIAAAFEEHNTAKTEAENEKRKDALKERLDRGLIDQQRYDEAVAEMDARLDAEKAAVARKQAIREKALQAMQIGINTAAAIMRIWADVPKVDFGVSTGVLTAMAATIGATQLAAVLATPIPKAAKGGIVRGNSHQLGGALIEAEGGERIVSTNASRAFPELLNLISYIGKHAGVPDTGYGARMAMSGGAIDADALADKIGQVVAEKMKDVKVYAAITEIREADKNYARVEGLARY